MNTPSLSHTAKMLGVLVFGLLISILPSAHGQGIVSAGVTGVVRDSGGRPVSGASIEAVHVPTNTTYTATTGSTGRYTLRNLVVGGPYTFTANATGFQSAEQTEVITQLGSDIDVNFGLKPSEVITLDKFVITSESDQLDAAAAGAGSIITNARIQSVPTAKRSIGDMARTNPLVTFRQAITDRDDQMITAVGQNNRYNSILLDGARINDQFGLNASGIQSFFNPISLDTVEQFSVSISPYDVRQSGFTGAAINAVTKSGTNQLHGSVYGFYTSANYAGENITGTSAVPIEGIKPLDTQKTWGATLGGPILKNRLFFFLNYEKLERETAASVPGFTPDSTQLSTITARLAAINAAIGSKSVDFGSFGGPALLTEEEKKLFKIDWNISRDHRLSVRYNETEGVLPQFGRYSTASSFAPTTSLVNTASVGTNLSSNFYTQSRTEKVWAGSVFSNWTSNFKTELRYAKTSYQQLTSSPSIFPEVRIFGVSGVNVSGAAISNGVLFAGTEQFRHGNVIELDTESYAANADYIWGNFTLSGGLEKEDSNFYNLFRGGSYGLIEYASLTDFLNDTPNAFRREYIVAGTPVADVSQFGITGVYGQAKWDISPRLNLTLGGRVDFIGSDIRPLFNQGVLTTFGVRNDGLPDGVSEFAPRVGFNWSLDETRVTQVRGGVGRFLGRAPWVFFSNSFSNPGVGRFGITNTLSTTTPPPTLVSYINTQFDPANPIGVAPNDGDPNARRTINLLSDKIHLPAVWRANLAVDRKLGILDSTLSAEFVFTKNDYALFSDNMNIKPLVVTPTSGPAVGLDGRQRFNGSSTGAGAFSTAFNEVIRVRNVDAGQSAYLSLAWDRQMKNHWAANLSYTHGRSTEAQSSGQTVAVDGWTRNAVFNQNAVENSRSDFEVEHRLQFTASYEFEPWKKWKTLTSLYYEGRTGNPYSFAYNSDLNTDGVSGNDLVYVPTGLSDAKVDFSGLTAPQADAYMRYINSSELGAYKGSYAPRNSFRLPWQNRLDIRLSQTIPIFKPVHFEVFADFINFGYWLSRDVFGYTEELGNNNGVYARRLLGNAAYASDGRVRPTGITLDSAGNYAPAGATINPLASRWRIQVGARLKF
ncbi:TonB-dependent receptor [Oleiharenicola lentus]|uniref:TonB-dependent receptor n=1 Tax=Oleiharenicola lentus TaxID=2508720 RepID=UPI003F661EDC